MDESIKKKIELVLANMSMAELGRKLGGISGQRIGQYMAGTRKPKKDFFDAWESVFGYRLESNDEKPKKYSTEHRTNDLLITSQLFSLFLAQFQCSCIEVA